MTYFTRRYEITSVAGVIGLLLTSLCFGSAAYAQENQSGIPNMPNQPTQVSGKYSNSESGLDITLPDGWSGMEIKLPGSSSTMVTVMPGGMQASQGQTPTTMMAIAVIPKSEMKTMPTQPTGMPKDVKCDNPSVTSKTVNGVSVTESVIECTGATSMKIKYDLAQTDKYYVSASYIATPSSGFDSNLATFDTALGSLHLANAIQAPAVPEFPVAVLGAITVLMMGVAIIVTRRQQLFKI